MTQEITTQVRFWGGLDTIGGNIVSLEAGNYRILTDFGALFGAHEILQKQHLNYERIIVVTESLFSMDGDFADLPQLVAFKRQFDNVMLYVDEAHGIGVYGEQGLGVAEQMNCLPYIDFLVGTFGKTPLYAP